MSGMIVSSVVNAFSSDRSANTQADAATQAANTQAASNQYAADLQKQMFEKQIELQEPFRQGGLAGQNRLLELLGLGGKAGAPGYGKYATAEFGGVKGFDPASLMQGFTAKDFQADPGYAFRMSEGMKALERSAAARGGLLSGATLRGTQRYGQDLASQEYQNAFNRFQANRATQGQEYGNAFSRFQAERANTLNPFQSLAGVAQSSANTVGQQAGAYGANVGNLMSATGASNANALLAAGNARASAYQGYGTAAGQAIQGISSFFKNQSTPSYSGPSYGSNPSFDNSFYDTMSYD
jgi:hypothetical protein